MRGLERRSDGVTLREDDPGSTGLAPPAQVARFEGSRSTDRARARALLDGDGDPTNVIPIHGDGGAGAGVLDIAADRRELIDFLASDVDPVPADPAFRERLREELWELVLEEGVGEPGAGQDLRPRAPGGDEER